MGHIVHGKCDGIIEVVAQHDPDGLQSHAAAGNHKKQNTGDRQQRSRQKQPGASLTFRCAGALHDLTHDDIGDSINYFRDNGENDKEAASPKACHLEDICIVNIKV